MSVIATILAGDEFGSPVDYPSNRLDGGGADSLYNAVGAVEIVSTLGSFVGSGVALSEHWVLTAGHNVDLSSVGAVSGDVSWNLHLPDYGIFGFDAVYLQPDYTGFGNPSMNDDLALLYTTTGLPSDLNYCLLYTSDAADD